MQNSGIFQQAAEPCTALTAPTHSLKSFPRKFYTCRPQ